MQSFVLSKVADWQQELERLASFSLTEPHVAFAALTHDLRRRWTFVLFTVDVEPDVLSGLEKFIAERLLPPSRVTSSYQSRYPASLFKHHENLK